MNKLLPFGGCSFILFGDFHQLDPVGEESLIRGLMESYNPNNKIVDPTIPKHIGRESFKLFKLYDLKYQHRSKDDHHTSLIAKCRNLKVKCPIDNDIIKYIKENIITQQIIENNPNWLKATVAVTSNVEKLAVLKHKIKFEAILCNTCVLTWKKTFAESFSQHCNPNTLNQLYSQFPNLYHYCVIGGKATLTMNISPQKGLANGSSCTIYVILYNDSNVQTNMNALISNAIKGSIVEIETPDYVLIEIEKKNIVWLKEASMVANKYIYPLSINKYAQMADKIKIPTQEAGGKALEIKYYQHEFEMALVSTIHKLQGSTEPLLLVAISQRPKGIKSLDLSAFLVAFSRTETIDNLKFIVMEDNEDLEYLKNLKQNSILYYWFNSYNAITHLFQTPSEDIINELFPSTEMEEKKKIQKALTKANYLNSLKSNDKSTIPVLRSKLNKPSLIKTTAKTLIKNPNIINKINSSRIIVSNSIEDLSILTKVPNNSNTHGKIDFSALELSRWGFGTDVNAEDKQILCYVDFGNLLGPFESDIQDIKNTIPNIQVDDRRNAFNNLFNTYIQNNHMLRLFRYHNHDNNTMKTTGDGLCGYRALFQLYHTLLFKEAFANNTTNDGCNIYCKGKNLNLLEHEQNNNFTTFLLDLLEKVNQHSLTNDERLMLNDEKIQLQLALNYIIPYVRNVKSQRDEFMLEETNAWMHDLWLIHCMKLLEMKGSYLCINDYIFDNHPSNQHVAMITNTSFSHRIKHNYDECLQIFSSNYISFSHKHFEVEPFLDINYDIQLFQLAVTDVMNKLFDYYF
jgi:hypothetical protein